MCANGSNETFEAVREALAGAGRLLVLAHNRPDGDALGAMLALVSSARAAGKTAHMLVDDDIPAKYAFLFPGERPLRRDVLPALGEAVDRIVIVDTSAVGQLDHVGKFLPAWTDKIIVVDHHATCERIGSLQWNDSTAAAAGVMVGELLEALGWPVGWLEARALMAAVTSDTGWFHFANTDGRCLRLAARWLEAGVRPDELYAQLFQTARPEQLALVARMLGSLRLRRGGRLAEMAIRKGDFAATGALPEETENLVNEALRVGTVETVVLLVENGEGVVRVNLRSRQAVDVSAVARQFGGGGHRRAAGLRSSEPLEALREKIVAACEKALGEAGL